MTPLGPVASKVQAPVKILPGSPHSRRSFIRTLIAGSAAALFLPVALDRYRWRRPLNPLYHDFDTKILAIDPPSPELAYWFEIWTKDPGPFGLCHCVFVPSADPPIAPPGFTVRKSAYPVLTARLSPAGPPAPHGYTT